MIRGVMVSITPEKISKRPSIWKWKDSVEFDQVDLSEKQMTNNMLFKLFRRAKLLHAPNDNHAVCLDKYTIPNDNTLIYEIQHKRSGEPICALVVDLSDDGCDNLLNS